MFGKKLVLIALLLIISIVPSVLYAGVTGKIIGQITDQETGDALPGANVQIVGTNMGAATNAQGGFIILNVPPGIYAVKATFIGYQQVTIENVRVSVDLSTDVDFALPTEVLEGEAISIVAERPLVNKNSTNETHIMTSEDIENMPVRSYAGVVSTASGVVSARGTMYVRGGRADEIAYYVDGVYTNDLRTGQRVGDVPITSLEQINYQAGGFSAEYGFANSGVVIASSKSGAHGFNFSGEVITDEFLSQEDKMLGAYSYGYNVYNLTASGPIVSDNIKFFASAEKTYRKDRRPSAGTHPVLGDNYTTEEILYTTAWMTDSLETPIPLEERILAVDNVEGPLPNNWLDRWSLNGNLLFDFTDIRVKVGGNATFSENSRYSQYRSFANGDHTINDKDYNYSAYGKLTHTIGSKTFYEGTAYYSEFKNELGDPVTWRNMMDYGDATDVNGNGVFTAEMPGNSLNGYSRPRLGQGIFAPVTPYTQYHLNKANVLGLKFDFTHQYENHEMKTGFEYRYNTMRRFAMTRPWQLAGIYANDPTIIPVQAYNAGYTEAFGYPNVWDNHEVDPNSYSEEGLDGAKHPILAAYYLQDKVELDDLVLNLGLRFDYIDANDKRLKDPYNVKLKDGLLDESTLEDTEAQISVSPRLGISFPVTDKTVFHGQWGKFTQQPELQYLYNGWNYMASMLSQGNQVEIGNPDLKPVSTTSYEIGVGQQLGFNSSLSVTAYYKEIRDMVVLKNRVNANPITYAQYQNGDYGTVKGISATFRMRRTNRIAANLNYTLQSATGTGSTSDSNFFVTWIGNEYYPVFVAPLDYDQRHTMSVNVDFRTNPEDGPEVAGMYPLGNLGVNVLASIGSGFPYTPKRIGDTIFSARFATAYPVAGTNSAYSNWTNNIDLRVDKSFTVMGQKMNMYLWVINVLGSKNPFNRKNNNNEFMSGIYEATGRPDDNGWLATPDGQNWIETNGGERAEAMYRAFMNSPLNWEAPRQIRLGLRFEIGQ